ncbi:MAG: hypothetical protein ACOC6F_01335 [bacterium]
MIRVQIFLDPQESNQFSKGVGDVVIAQSVERVSIPHTVPADNSGSSSGVLVVPCYEKPLFAARPYNRDVLSSGYPASLA